MIIETAPHILVCVHKGVQWQASDLDLLRNLLEMLYTQPDL